MTDNTSKSPKATESQDATRMPVRLVRGDASPEELAALVAVLATAGGDSDPDPTDRAASGRVDRSPWNSLARMVPMTPPHGPGGWRASAFPR